MIVMSVQLRKARPVARSPRKARHEIDRSSPLPLYAQVRRGLEARLAGEEWRPGDRIPGEPELCKEYGVSRPVIRQALQELAMEGAIVRRKGLGTFVAEPKVVSRSLVHSLVGFYQDMEQRGLATETSVIEQTLLPAGEKIGGRLRTDVLTPVVKISRVRSVGGHPVVLVSSYLPYALCPGLIQADLRHQSLYAFLEQEYGLRIAAGRREIEAVLASDEEGRLLEVERGAPLLRLESVSYLEGGQPMEYFNGVFLSRFVVELGRQTNEDDAVPMRVGQS
ncbi:MAG: putative GntR family transcriptional regulator [Anaerolineales bacterium]|nr:putative GntR family transcriptional regulator [Anaerolineales bacterium]